MPSLSLRPISQASAIQRAHRAGRQRPGRALRLYTRAGARCDLIVSVVVEIGAIDVPWRKSLVRETLQFDNGDLLAPTAPGLGVELIEEACQNSKQRRRGGLCGGAAQITPEPDMIERLLETDVKIAELRARLRVLTSRSEVSWGDKEMRAALSAGPGLWPTAPRAAPTPKPSRPGASFGDSRGWARARARLQGAVRSRWPPGAHHTSFCLVPLGRLEHLECRPVSRLGWSRFLQAKTSDY